MSQCKGPSRKNVRLVSHWDINVPLGTQGEPGSYEKPSERFYEGDQPIATSQIRHNFTYKTWRHNTKVTLVKSTKNVRRLSRRRRRRRGYSPISFSTVDVVVQVRRQRLRIITRVWYANCVTQVCQAALHVDEGSIIIVNRPNLPLSCLWSSASRCSCRSQLPLRVRIRHHFVCTLWRQTVLWLSPFAKVTWELSNLTECTSGSVAASDRPMLS